MQAALLLAMIGNTARALDVEALAFLGFPVGALLWMGGLVSWGAALLRSRAVPRYAGWALILLEPASIAFGVALAPIAGLADHGSYSGAFPKAVALVAVGVALRRAWRSQDSSGVRLATTVRG